MARPRLALVLALVALAPALAGCTAAERHEVPIETVHDCREPVAMGLPPFWFLETAASVRPAAPPVGDEDLERAELAAAAAALTPDARADAERWNATAPTALWTRELLDLVPVHVTNVAKGNVPRLARSMALLEIGMHDALVAALAAQACHARLAPDGASRGAYPDARAAVAGAASLLLAAAVPNETARFEPLAREAAESRVALGLAWPSDVEAGFSMGQEVARALIRARADDGFDRPWTGSVPQRPCAWQRVPPIYDAPLEPLWGGVAPFLMPRGDALRPPPPPPCGSDEARTQVRALHEASLDLAPAQREAALRWAGGQGTTSPPGMWMEIALAESAERGLDAVDTSRVASLVAVALADAAIAAWDAKYAYWTERPVTAIQRDLDPEWLPLVEAPNFPGYVSGHATFSGAASVVLAYHFPEEAVEFERMAQEATMSRFWGGIHVTADNEEGLAMGRAIGRLAVERDVGLP